ncbi:hypothetical protein BGX21_003871 [Mortierella sp. AD011]|nr:hypothetical protein BGX20_008624 [Mortierella sp. AD010]KAF9400608.1 hypothetical protein BGX21_003871 [Mortierella sp. AD011]
MILKFILTLSVLVFISTLAIVTTAAPTVTTTTSSQSKLTSTSILGPTSTPIIKLISTPIPKLEPNSTFTKINANLDECGKLGQLKASEITFGDVASCYKSIPYDADVANTALEAVYTLFNNYYIFRDSALTHDTSEPFNIRPVNITKQLDTIRNTNYTNDFSFHTAITKAINILHDGHAYYEVDCYDAYTFAQPLALYSPVENGTQFLRVYKDFSNRGYEECEVLTIDGQPGLPYMQSWSDFVSFSKDAGVRLNYALVSQFYYAVTSQFETNAGLFSQRRDLPENSTITYELQCKSLNSTTTVQDAWQVFPNTNATFTDTESYLNNVCRANLAKSSHKRSLESGAKPRLKTHVHRRSVFLDAAASDTSHQHHRQVNAASGLPPQAPTQSLVSAEKLGNGEYTAYYLLTSHPDVGIIVVQSHLGQLEEMRTILSFLGEFHRRNVTKLIFDFQSNPGGYIEFSTILVQLVFPLEGDDEFLIPMDLRTDESIQRLSAAVFNYTADYLLYDAWHYADFTNSIRYQSDALFTNARNMTRNGQGALYSQGTSLMTSILAIPTPKQLSEYPWTNNSANIRVLSDGRCGSACALSSVFFDMKNVTSYAVGGNLNENLSVFSYPGGSVSNLAEINQMYSIGKVDSPMADLPYKGIVSIPLVEAYFPGSNVPLEYDTERFPATNHIHFDEKNSRSRDVLWSQVAADAWK